VRWKKLIIVLIITILLMILGYCRSSKAEPASSSEAEPEPTPDLWQHPDEFELPEIPDFELLTPQPSSTDVPIRDENQILPTSTALTPITGVSVTAFNPWRQWRYNNDTSVWYGTNYRNISTVMTLASGYGIFRPWADSAPFVNCDRWYLNPLNDDGTIYTSFSTQQDIFNGSFNLSFFDDYTLTTDYVPQTAVSNTLTYQFRLNRAQLRIVSAPAWIGSIGLTPDTLYDHLYFDVSCYMEDAVYNNRYTKILETHQPFSSLLSGVSYDLNLMELFHYDPDNYLETVAFNFNIYIDADMQSAYQQYRADNGITGVAPVYLDWYTSTLQPNTGRAFMVFWRGYKTSSVQDDRNWLQNLFIPTSDQVSDLFDLYVSKFGDDGTTAFVVGIRDLILDLVNSGTNNQPDFILTLPEMSVPVDGSSYTFSDEYQYNMTATLRSMPRVQQAVYAATSFLITFAFANSVIAMAVAVFDLKWWDGV